MIWTVLAAGLLVARAGLSAEPAGRLVSVTGQVVATSQGKAPRPLKAGDPVLEGDTLQSEAASSAKFLMNDQTILDLNPSSQLLVEHYQLKSLGNRNVSISVLNGTIRASVNQHLTNGGKFSIRTRSATMGVRGTEFVVQSDSRTGQSQLTVLKGLVQAASSDAGAALTGVSPGNQFTVNLGSAPRLVKLSAEELASVFRGATVRDSTFVSAIEIKKSSSRSGSVAATSALNTLRASVTRSPASQHSQTAMSASIPGKTDSLYSLRNQAVAPQGRNVKLNVGFTQ